MDKKKKPWKCRLFGCDYAPGGLRATQVTDSIAVLRWTCKRCGEKYEHMAMCLSDDAMKRYREQMENRNAKGEG